MFITVYEEIERKIKRRLNPRDARIFTLSQTPLISGPEGRTPLTVQTRTDVGRVFDINVLCVSIQTTFVRHYNRKPFFVIIMSF